MIGMRPADLTRLHEIRGLTISSNGQRIVFAVSRADPSTGVPVSQLWTVDTSGGQPARLLTDGRSDSDPVYSPDGRWLAFLRADADGRRQPALMPSHGGDVTPLGAHPFGCGPPVWSADSRRIAYVAPVPTSPAANAVRLIRSLDYQQDGVGFTYDRPEKIFVVECSSPGEWTTPARQLTFGPSRDWAVAWHPDSQVVAFVASRSPRSEQTLANDVYLCGLAGGEPRQVTNTSIAIRAAAFDSTGQRILLLAIGLGRDGLDSEGEPAGLWAVPADGQDAAPTRLTDPDALDIPRIPSRLAVRDGVVFVVGARRGSTHLLRLDQSGEPPVVAMGGELVVRDFDVAGGPERAIAAAVYTPDSAGEIMHLAGDCARTLTDLGRELRDETELYRPEEIHAVAPDGYPVHGWLVRPAGPGPHPVLLDIHEGPFSYHSTALSDEVQIHVAAGYATLLCNPRGSSGYGYAHGRAIVTESFTLAADDLIAFVDHAIATQPELDAGRLGVLGGSYGGQMTTWLVAHDHRFRAAITERALNDLVSFAGTSDVGPRRYLLTRTNAAQRAAQSPLTYVNDISTPTLVVHAVDDLRCPLEQGQRLYAQLKVNGVDTALLLFPGGGHELPRRGSLAHRVQRCEYYLQWWARYLPTDANPLRDDNPFR